MLNRIGACVLALVTIACSGGRVAGDAIPNEVDDAAVDAPARRFDGGALGRACIPGDEGQRYFSGYELSEVNLEPPSDACLGGICLVNHFQGRVTCPYGQSDQEAMGNGTRAESELCHTAPGANAASRVALAVAPQAERRRPTDAVYCTCRCAGPDPSANYCACPSGFECVEVVPFEGSYCLKSGTAYDPALGYGLACRAGPTGELPCGGYDGW